MSVAPPGRLRSRERLPVSPTLAPIRQNDNPPDRGPPGNRRPGPVSRRGDLSGAVIHKNRSGVYTVGPWQFADRCTRTARVYASRAGRGRAGPGSVRLDQTISSAFLDRVPTCGRWTATGGPPRRT